MKKIQFAFLFIIIFTSCKNETPFDQFDVETISVNLNFYPNQLIQYKNGYLCSTSSYSDEYFKLIYLDKSFKIDSTLSKKINQGLNDYVQSIWTSNDSLFVITNLRNYSILCYCKNKWIKLSSGTTTKENFMHHEQNIPLYEDKEYAVRSCCMGEFGGAIYFHHKKSKRIFSCPSTCIQGVGKFNNSFYVSSSLAHIGGFSTIIRIKDPKKLYEIKTKKQLLDCSWYDIYSNEPPEFEIKHPKGYDKGYETIIDSFEILINSQFEFNKNLYWIYSDKKNTYIGTVENKKLIPLQKIVSDHIYSSGVRELKKNSGIIPFRSKKNSGVIIRKKNKIKVVTFS